MKSNFDKIKEEAETSLLSLINLLLPMRLLGDVHKEIIKWWERPSRRSHQLLLLPRDHMKSALIALRAVQRIIRDPSVRILYISSTAGLAEKQLKFIKDILTSDIVRHYWPELINPDEGKREKWSLSEMAVDHPKRKEENVRDSTIFTGGLTTSLTGFHCDIAILDDVVVKENAYTEDGRLKVQEQYSLLASIEAGDAEEWVVGTRYHPKDLYSDLKNMVEEIYNDEGDIIGTLPIYETFERQVENKGDGTGKFLWPRQQRFDGKWFGFDAKILSKKRGKYLDKVQFRAQYYNDPNDVEGAGISRDHFQYYDRKFLVKDAGKWYFKGQRLNVFASVDFAYTTGLQSDFTAIVVVGVDSLRNYYVLDIERFKTSLISDFYKTILRLYSKWEFPRLRAECTAAQSMIAEDLRVNYIRPNGLNLIIDEVKPSGKQGSKNERISATLQPRYANRQMWHYEDGMINNLEEELILLHPAHDDIKDALASAIEVCIPPASQRQDRGRVLNFQSHSRFGGIV